MKKVKLMLLSLCILAGAGGALAFTSKSGVDCCFAQVAKTDVCANAICQDQGKTNTTTDANMYICTTSVPANGCRSSLNCTGSPINATVE